MSKLLKILISADMEGVSGVVHRDQVTRTNKDYERFRRIMTDDVNAAIRGAYDAGADSVLVTDGHGNGRNILVEDLDARARLNSGSPAPFSMVQGINSSITAAMFVGYHARMGTPKAIMDHTWSREKVANLWLNGQIVGELGLNAAVCGHFGTPVVMVSGDRAVCVEAAELLPHIEVAMVKRSSGHTAAECLSPIIAQHKIYTAASHAVKKLSERYPPSPFQLQKPVTVTIEFLQSSMADGAANMLDLNRLDGRKVEFIADDMIAAYRVFTAAMAITSK